MLVYPEGKGFLRNCRACCVPLRFGHDQSICDVQAISHIPRACRHRKNDHTNATYDFPRLLHNGAAVDFSVEDDFPDIVCMLAAATAR